MEFKFIHYHQICGNVSLENTKKHHV